MNLMMIGRANALFICTASDTDEIHSLPLHAPTLYFLASKNKIFCLADEKKASV